MNCRLRALGQVICLSWGLLANGSVRAQEVLTLQSSALQRLQNGNERFATDKLAKKNLGTARRQELAQGQRPFAVVLACADSRVAPELIFDQGLGDLFVVRVAGNVTNPEIIGSIEYALAELKTPLVVVLGHEECGAVKAALSEERLPGNLGKLIARIHIGREAALASAIRANVVHQVEELTRQRPIIKDFAQSKRVAIRGGIYSLSTGKVQWLEQSSAKQP
jgi:carbonic anhydrase